MAGRPEHLLRELPEPIVAIQCLRQLPVQRRCLLLLLARLRRPLVAMKGIPAYGAGWVRDRRMCRLLFGDVGSAMVRRRRCFGLLVRAVLVFDALASIAESWRMAAAGAAFAAVDPGDSRIGFVVLRMAGGNRRGPRAV